MTFKMWGLLHIIFILMPIVFLVILMFLMKNKTFEQKRKVGVILSIVAIILLVLRNLEIYLKVGWDAELIPLQICHFANFVLLFAFLKDSKPLFALTFAFHLPAAILSIIFANSLENYATIISFRGIAYIFGHVLIVLLALWAWLDGFVVINKKILFKTLGIMIGLYIGAVFINNLLVLTGITPNYFYTLKPENGTPLELFFTWGTTLKIGFLEFNPVYLLLTGLFGIVVVLAFYGIYLLRELIIKKHKAIAL